MWTIEVENPGESSRLVKGERERPWLLPNEVLIKTHAAGINRADLFQAQGLYPPPPGASTILGMEVAGVIEEIGGRVTNFAVGDRVCALLEGGGYAEYAKVSAYHVLPLPKGLDFIEGAALPEAIFTVYSNFFHHAKLMEGESILIHGGSSGIGTFAIQIAVAYGIKCYTTAGTDEKCAFLETLGAKAINYKEADFVEEIKSATGGAGVNCIIDIVGGEYFNRNLKCLANSGRMICLSFLGGARAEANLAPIVYKNLTITGTTMRNKSIQQKAIIASEVKENIWKLLENGTVKPIIYSVFEASAAQDAHELMQSSLHTGKIILKCD